LQEQKILVLGVELNVGFQPNLRLRIDHGHTSYANAGGRILRQSSLSVASS
jgi:hypothetical protein